MVATMKASSGSPIQETKVLSIDYRILNAQLLVVVGNRTREAVTLADIPKIDKMLQG